MYIDVTLKPVVQSKQQDIDRLTAGEQILSYPLGHYSASTCDSTAL
jgi:hypothetical protein